ncbi:hypothetical protein LCGC14_1903330 [marine sediment metagenome]|uniref:Uncharacterized protein n=1 Tax=marine sediment metagenome TaxID=412755 RepID=A0A0F9I9T3_9ZZZZ
MIADVVIDTSLVTFAYGVLLVISLIGGIIGSVSVYMRKRTGTVVEAVIAQKVKDGQLPNSAQVDAIAARLDDGITGKLDDLVEAHRSTDMRLAELTGMVKTHFEWTGPDRRTE